MWSYLFSNSTWDLKIHTQNIKWKKVDSTCPMPIIMSRPHRVAEERSSATALERPKYLSLTWRWQTVPALVCSELLVRDCMIEGHRYNTQIWSEERTESWFYNSKNYLLEYCYTNFTEIDLSHQEGLRRIGKFLNLGLLNEHSEPQTRQHLPCKKNGDFHI